MQTAEQLERCVESDTSHCWTSCFEELSTAKSANLQSLDVPNVMIYIYIVIYIYYYNAYIYNNVCIHIYIWLYKYDSENSAQFVSRICLTGLEIPSWKHQRDVVAGPSPWHLLLGRVNDIQIEMFRWKLFFLDHCHDYYYINMYIYIYIDILYIYIYWYTGNVYINTLVMI